MTADIPALTLNQWIMAGSIAFFCILLLGWVCLCVFSRTFRQDLYRDIEESPRIEEGVFHSLSLREFYHFWIGNIIDLAQILAGTGKHPAGKEHLLSVLAWAFLLGCGAGYVTGWYNRDMWGFFGMLVIGASFFYGGFKVIEMFRKPKDR